MNFTQIAKLVRDERSRQIAKWGVQEHNAPEWMSILTEEVGEAAREANQSHWADSEQGYKIHQDNLRTELVQAAAVIFQILEGMPE